MEIPVCVCERGREKERRERERETVREGEVGVIYLGRQVGCCEELIMGQQCAARRPPLQPR